MKTKAKSNLFIGVMLLVFFALWTVLIQTVDVKPAGVNGTGIGFSSVNLWCHWLTGVNMTLYTVTDWLGLVPLFGCFVLGLIGFLQIIKRKSLFKVDFDIIASGVYYIIVILCYLGFEMIPINYRPVLINGVAEASYPSSTTLLVLSVMPTLADFIISRNKSDILNKLVIALSVLFCSFMVIGRLISGVHWVTDIAGSILLSAGLFFVYKGVILWSLTKKYRS